MFTPGFETYKSVFESISDVVVVMRVEENSRYRYEFANHAAYKTGGMTDQRIGKLVEEVYSCDYGHYLINQYNSVVSSRRSVTFEDKNPSLKRQISEVTATPILNSDGVCNYIVTVAKDISVEENLLDQLDTKNQLFEALFMQTPDSIVLLDLAGRVDMENYQYRVTHGWSHDELVSCPFLPSIPNHLQDEAKQLYRRVIDGEHIESFQTKRITKDGTLFDVSLNMSPIKDRNGEVNGIIISERNVSEQLKHQRLLEESEEKFRIIAENMTDLVAVMDPTGLVKYASPSYEKVLGVSPNWYIGQPGIVLVHEDDREKVVSAFRKAIKSKKTVKVEYLKHNVARNDYLEVESLLIPIADTSGYVEKIISVSRDITERQSARRRMEYLAYHDPLTDLPNRRLFRKRLKQAISDAEREGTQLAVLFLDCDKFKTINDTLGHDAGDDVLQFFAYTLQKSVRDVDTVARFAGDEFAILLPGVSSQANALNVAERIVEAVRSPWEWNGQTIRVTTSIGVSFYPIHKDIKTLLVSADSAMYQAKNSGGNRASCIDILDQVRNTQVFCSQE